MLEVTFIRDARKRVSSLLACGHAEAGTRGKDLVCAAASSILQAAQLGLEEHAKVALHSRTSPGLLELRWPERARDDAAVRAIVATAEIALRALARQYPQHVRVRQRRRADKPGKSIRTAKE